MLDWAEINTSAGVYHFQDLDAFMLGVEYCHAKERARNNAVVFVNNAISAGGDSA
jgi:hypothetical protein